MTVSIRPGGSGAGRMQARPDRRHPSAGDGRLRHVHDAGGRPRQAVQSALTVHPTRPRQAPGRLQSDRQGIAGRLPVLLPSPRPLPDRSGSENRRLCSPAPARNPGRREPPQGENRVQIPAEPSHRPTGCPARRSRGVTRAGRYSPTNALPTTTHGMKNPDGYGFLTINVDPDPDEVEVREFRGTKFLVAPVVAVAEGLLNGGFLPFREIQKSAPGWNGVPVTVQHPEDGDGNFVPANQPEVLERYQVGRLLNVEASDPKLEGELWMNLAEVKWLDENDDTLGPLAKEAVRMLKEGDPLEVSTGYWHGEQQSSGSFDGHEYDTVQVDLLPDHLAVLPNSEGACNWEGSTTASGCGAPRANVDGDADSLAEAAAGAADGFAFAANDLDIQGEALGNRLEDRIEDQTNDDLGRGDLIGSMAEAAEIDESTVNAIVRGEVNCPPRERLEAFAGVLDTDVDTLIDAAEEDGCSYGEQNSALQNLGRRVLGAIGYPLDDQQPTTNDDGVPYRLHGANCNCGCQIDMTNYTDEDLERIANQSAFSVEELKELDATQVEKIDETLDLEGQADGDGDGPGGDGDGDGAAPEVQELQETVDRLEERLEEREQERLDGLRQRVVNNSPLDEDELPETEEKLEALAEKFGALTDTTPDYAGRAAGTSDPSGDDELEDYEMTAASLEVRADVDTAAEGGD